MSLTNTKFEKFVAKKEDEMIKLRELMAVARGDEPADLLLTNLRLVNVYTGEIYPTEVAIAGGMIVGVGPDYEARETLDLDGRYLCPGFINAHVHVESSMAMPTEFARAVLPRGTTTAASMGYPCPGCGG